MLGSLRSHIVVANLLRTSPRMLQAEGAEPSLQPREGHIGCTLEEIGCLGILVNGIKIGDELEPSVVWIGNPRIGGHHKGR
jgi:hypothetical protein